MANELERVRISAAELRAEASSSVNTTVCQKGERKRNTILETASEEVDKCKQESVPRDLKVA